LTSDLSTLRQMEDAGAAAIVLYSLFEEQITQESHVLNEHLLQGTESYAEALSYFPQANDYRSGPDTYLEVIRRAKSSLEIPIIASLNGVSAGGWIRYAKLFEEAGVDAIELNIYYLSTDMNESSTDVEMMYVEALQAVKSVVSIPVAMKLSPYFSAMAHLARLLEEAGADGLVLFNRFYQPDLDLDELAVATNLNLSSSAEMRLPLRWIAILYGRLQADLALTTGVHTAADVLKGVAAGAAVTMLASELLQNGIKRITELQDAISLWLTEREYHSLAELQGSLSQKNCAEPGAFERANYMRIINSYAPDYSWRKKA
jgi:dihydroorotate dehydrogenase (fumarate)